MKDKKQSKILFNLAVAGLITEAEFDNFSDELLLKVPIERKKSLYLVDILGDSDLKPFIDINLNNGQYTIHSHSLLGSLKNQWYQENTKIFSNILDPGLISLQSIVICINLFGIRKLETISIPTVILILPDFCSNFIY